MHFFIENDDLLEKYNTIWNKVSADVRKQFDSELVFNKFFWKTKIKSYGNDKKNKIKKVLKMNSNHTCLAVISLDSALKKYENCHLQVFLKESKYIEKLVNRHINII